MIKTTAIDEATGAWETVELDGFGRVPRGYRAPTSEDRALGRGRALRDEIAACELRGDVVLAAQARRTLADARANGIAV